MQLVKMLANLSTKGLICCIYSVSKRIICICIVFFTSEVVTLYKLFQCLFETKTFFTSHISIKSKDEKIKASEQNRSWLFVNYLQQHCHTEASWK